MNMINKRVFLLITMLLVAPFVNAMSFKKAQPLPKISVQLHSVKDDVSADFDGTLKAIAEMGFAGVEFAGKYGPYKDDPKALKTFLSSLGLRASGAHINLKVLNKETAANQYAFFKALGVKLVIISHDARIDNPERIDELIAELNELSEMAVKFDIALAYHNHAKEFKAFNDTTFWDYLADNTPRSFALQLDVGWARFAGVDAIEYVKRYPTRTQTSHLKIRTRKERGVVPTEPVIIGEDDLDWQKLIKTFMRYGGTQWMVIEQEEYPAGMTPLQSVAASKKGLDKIIKNMGY